MCNGYRETGMFVSYQGVDFEVAAMDGGLGFRCFQEMMQNLWMRTEMFSDHVQEDASYNNKI